MKVILSQIEEKVIRASFQKSVINRRKTIIKIRESHLPCYLFELNFTSSRKNKTVFVICDALKGKIRRLNWPQPCRFYHPEMNKFYLTEAEALAKVQDELKWFPFLPGLHLKRKYRLAKTVFLGQVGYPFWLVYFKRRGRYDFAVYDALSGKKEDFFGKDIFLAYFGLEPSPMA